MVASGDLFNQKTIERLCEDVKITPKQKQASREWLKLLDENKLEDEKNNYPKFMQIVLQDILGYPIKEINYESGNVEFQFGNSEGKNILCFEAKGTSTKDLFAPQHRAKKEHETPVKQTWDYVGINGLDYGICTNYKDFVLITRSTYPKYHFFDFNSIKRNEEKLKEFVGIFSKERIIEKGFVEKLHKESIIEEREFTKEFYKLYHETRLMMIKALQEKQIVSKTEAIYYTQLLLNRLIFIFFVEDRGFVPDKHLFTNRILHILESSQFTEHSRKIYDDIKELFIAFDKGSRVLGVFGFNGSLFSGVMPEKVYFTDLKENDFFLDVKQNSKLLKSTKLNPKANEIIKKHPELNPIISNLLILDSFDFNTEVNVNILGHIFEQSISDLEELKQEGVSRRKKEGVYYTPEYITDYICRNTIIPYLSKSSANSTYELVEEYKDNLDELEKKFKEIKILDPACGSGAFLVKAIEVLLEIHKEIQGRKENKKYSGEQLQITHEWDENKEIRAIIENNIYGVDINPESIDITKLSLFLKLASNERKLIGLSQNIKTGNSLIDDKTVDSRAFLWEDQFPEILGKLIEDEGFDVVIGNPPYVRQELFKEIKSYLKSKYDSYNSLADLYVYFIEKGVNLLKKDGLMSFILPNKFLKTTYGKEIREFLKKLTHVKQIYDFDDYPVFEDATTYPMIMVLEKNEMASDDTFLFSKLIDKQTLNPIESLQSTQQKITYDQIGSSSWTFAGVDNSKIIEKLEQNSITLSEFVSDKIFRGISTGKNDVFIIDKQKKDELLQDPKASILIKKIVTGSEVKRYNIDFQDQYIIFVPWDYDLEHSHTVKNYLISNKKELEKRPEVKEGRFNWWCLSRYGSKNAIYLSQPKIIYPRITNQSNFCLDDSGETYLADNNFFISSGSKSLLGLLNSNVIFFFLRHICPTLRGGFYDFRRPYVEKIPIHKKINEYDKILSEKTDHMLQLNKEYLEKETKFWNRINLKFNIKKKTKKIEQFQRLDFNEFLNELNKVSQTKLSLKEQDEWENYFNERKNDLILIRQKILKCDDEINEIVYNLYGITNKERATIEQTIKT